MRSCKMHRIVICFDGVIGGNSFANIHHGGVVVHIDSTIIFDDRIGCGVV